MECAKVIDEKEKARAKANATHSNVTVISGNFQLQLSKLDSHESQVIDIPINDEDKQKIKLVDFPIKAKVLEGDKVLELKDSENKVLSTLHMVLDIFKKTNIGKSVECFLVGGSVRDFLNSYITGKQVKPHDFDITTNLTSDEIHNLFSVAQLNQEHSNTRPTRHSNDAAENQSSNYKPKKTKNTRKQANEYNEKDYLIDGVNYNIKQTGRDFPVVRITVNKGNSEFAHCDYEVATYRQDVYEQKGNTIKATSRKADTVEQDVTRRDLRVNALLYNVETNEIVDYVGGISDLLKSELNVCGSPRIRFSEDKLRILRAIRFQSKMNANLSNEIIEYLREEKGKGIQLLSTLSNDRIKGEFDKGVNESIKQDPSGESVKKYINTLYTFGLLDEVFKVDEVIQLLDPISNSEKIYSCINYYAILTKLLKPPKDEPKEEKKKKLYIQKLKDLKFNSDDTTIIDFLQQLISAFETTSTENIIDLKAYYTQLSPPNQSIISVLLCENMLGELGKQFVEFKRSIFKTNTNAKVKKISRKNAENIKTKLRTRNIERWKSKKLNPDNKN